MLSTFLIAATLIFAGLFMVWRSNDGVNFLLRMMFFCMMVLGLVTTLIHFIPALAVRY